MGSERNVPVSSSDFRGARPQIHVGRQVRNLRARVVHHHKRTCGVLLGSQSNQSTTSTYFCALALAFAPAEERIDFGPLAVRWSLPHRTLKSI
jgi:hypothetical protein